MVIEVTVLISGTRLGIGGGCGLLRYTAAKTVFAAVSRFLIKAASSRGPLGDSSSLANGSQRRRITCRFVHFHT